NINGGCQLASLKPQGTVVCNGGEKLYSPENQYGAIGSCGTVLQDTMTNVSAYTQTVNNSQLVNGQSIGAPTFQGLSGVNDFSWNGSTNSHWVQTLYRPRDGQGNEITNPQIVRGIEDLSTPSNRTIYEHVDGNWRPDKTYFNFSLGGEVGGPDFFETRVKRLELASTTQRPIEAVYPFNQSEAYQIPDWGSTSYQNQYDYNRDCNLDYECEGRNGTYLTLEERLRAYAALELPVASDPQYTFAYNDQMLRTVEASEATNLPACSPLKPYCSVKTETSVDLGVFRISQYPSGPPACHDGTYTRCTSEVVGNIEEPGDPDRYVDVELAKAVGLQEIERFNPGYERDCQDPSCAKIEVEMTSPITATVKASYEVPLFFPLDILLGHPSIKVSSEKEEVYEMASVGRG
ncbi:hypothetical protein JNK13_09980, partial [bacterium]|nr:hypothetical protein [bacterium]